MTSLAKCHDDLRLALRRKSRPGMRFIAVASNALAQAADVDQNVEDKAVMAIVAAETGPDAALTRTER